MRRITLALQVWVGYARVSRPESAILNCGSLELTYSAQIIPGWTVQPLLTYVWHPSGGDWPNALVVGGRSIWRF